MARIFISYRRRDSAYVASNLRDSLQARFGVDSVFLDIDNIPFGVDFRQYIENAVGQCDILLVLIGDHWLQSTDDQGRRQLEDPADFVRIEVESALKRNIPVVPVLVGEARMPRASDLPESLRDVAFRNAAEIRASRDQKYQIERLISDLAGHWRAQVPGTEKETATSQSDLDRQTVFLRLARQAFQGITNRRMWFSGAIPPEKAIAATKAYAPTVSQDAILLLYDNTIWGGAKDGFLLTVDAIYGRSGFSYRGDCRYADIQRISVKGDNDLVIIGKTKLVIMGLGKAIAEAVMNLIHSWTNHPT